MITGTNIKMVTVNANNTRQIDNAENIVSPESLIFDNATGVEGITHKNSRIKPAEMGSALVFLSQIIAMENAITEGTIDFSAINISAYKLIPSMAFCSTLKLPYSLYHVAISL